MIIFSEDKLTEEQLGRIRAIVPQARVVGGAELEADPGLIGKLEVSYGHIQAEQWPLAAGLRWLQITWAGLDTLLQIPAAREHHALITNVHIHAAAISEHLWGMCLMLTRNLHAAVREQDRRRWNKQSLIQGISNLKGRTLCVVGLGEIGRRCAAIGKAFGMEVIGIRRRGALGPAVEEADEILGPDDRLEAFARSRVIMAVLPHTARTVRFISRREMDVMEGAYLLNAGRGSCIDTDALVEALRTGKVRGAGLDVTEPEPLPPEHPLWGMPNAIITPHYSGNHPGYDTEAFAVFIDNLQRYVRGEPLRNVVDKIEGY
jgi:D-2-hydroxyacid dehydrogenase (NADP+)